MKREGSGMHYMGYGLNVQNVKNWVKLNYKLCAVHGLGDGGCEIGL